MFMPCVTCKKGQTDGNSSPLIVVLQFSLPGELAEATYHEVRLIPLARQCLIRGYAEHWLLVSGEVSGLELLPASTKTAGCSADSPAREMLTCC